MSEQSTGNPVPVKRPTIIRAGTKSGSTNIDEENSNQTSNSPSAGDPISQPADNSDVVIRRQAPTRPTTGPGRHSVQLKARPSSVHLKPEIKRSTRPASVHLPLSQAPSIRDKPSTGSNPQKKRPEITIISARPLSEVGGFSKDTCASGPSPVVKTPAAPKQSPAVDSTPNIPARASDPPVAARRRGLNLDVEASRSNPLSVENRSEPPGVTGATNMSGPPPPLPSNRPKGPYVPPPLPSSRPKAAYVHPGSVSSSSITEGGSDNLDPSQPSSEPLPKPRIQRIKAGTEEAPQGSSQAAPSRPPQPVNHTLVESSKPLIPNSEKPAKVLPPVPVAPKLEAVNKPHEAPVPSKPLVSKVKSQVPNPSVRPKPAEKPAVPQHTVVPPKPAEKPSLPHPVAPPKPSQRSVNNSVASTDNQAAADSHKHSESQPQRPTMPLKPPTAGTKYSRSDILSLFDSTFQKNSKPENKTTGTAAKNASTENALRFGNLAANAAASDGTRSKNEVQAFQYAGAVAQNTTAEDVNNIGGAMEELGKSEDGHKAVSSFSRIAKGTASDVRSSDSSSGDLKWQVASSAAKNVTADDAKNIGKAGVTIARSEQGRKAASSIFSIAKSSINQVNESQAKSSASQNSSARARPKNTGQQGGSGFSMNSLMGLMPPPKAPVQPAPKPAAAGGHRSAPVPKFKIATEPVKSEGGPRSKPTIIRPGADKPGSKPNSRNSSPDIKRKVPPPRPSAGPGKTKGAAPTRPNAPSNQLKSSSSQKPKRQAPIKPGGPLSKKSSPSESLPPRPGPGHPLYNKYMVSEPHGIALYDYKPIQPDELGFKANDMVILLKRIDADWLKGRCGSSEGLIPAAFLKIIKDIPQTGSKTKSSEPSAVAVFSYEGSASDELRFNEGDTIILLDKVGDQWLKGQCKGCTGIFPANHVKVIVDLPAKSTNSDVVSSGPRCIAKYDYDSVNPSDLTFKEGAVIGILDNAGPQWLKGQHKGKTGIFPDSYVEIIEALPSTKKSTSAMNGNSGNVATALYDFAAAESNEISFKEGDRITVLGQVSSDWLHGEVRGMKGNFPSGFVDHIPPNLPAFTDSPSEIGECIAKFDFEPAAEGELALKVGDCVTLLDYIGDDWLRGRLGLKDGIFPKSFVDIVAKQKGSASGTASSNATCKAMYDFYAEEADELTIVNGDVIEILEHVSADWLKGRLKGKTGKFPKAFVDIR